MTVNDIIEMRNESVRRIAMANLEHKAKWIKDDAVALASYVDELSALPDYETNAEEAVSDAEMALTEALFSVKVSKLRLARLRCPVIPVAAE